MTSFNLRCHLRMAITALLVLCAMAGCAGRTATPDARKTTPSRGTTVVLPFVDMAKLYGHPVGVRNPISSKVFFTGVVDEDGAAMMTNLLYQEMGQRGALIWGGYGVGAVSSGQETNGLGKDHLTELQNIGREKDAKTVLSGYLYAFRDKTGGSYGVEKPTQVIFELILVHVDTGRIIWQRSFKETQKSLSEDLTKLGTFIKRRGRWIGAREMGTNALKEMLKSLPTSQTP